MERRLKRIMLSFGMLPTAPELIAVLQKLPKDAKLVGLGEDFERGAQCWTFESQEWEPVSPGQRVPEFHPWIDRDDLQRAINGIAQALDEQIEKERQAAIGIGHRKGCICDLKYTGAKTHHPNCPLRS